jgi:cellulose synthase/poly-beta-1,6-N-acetylglucosamine synthase-like glycosyltransferase
MGGHIRINKSPALYNSLIHFTFIHFIFPKLVKAVFSLISLVKIRLTSLRFLVNILRTGGRDSVSRILTGVRALKPKEQLTVTRRARFFFSFLQSVMTGIFGLFGFWFNGTRSLPPPKSIGRGRKLTNHVSQMPNLRTGGSIPPLHHIASCSAKEQTYSNLIFTL